MRMQIGVYRRVTGGVPLYRIDDAEFDRNGVGKSGKEMDDAPETMRPILASF